MPPQTNGPVLLGPGLGTRLERESPLPCGRMRVVMGLIRLLPARGRLLPVRAERMGDGKSESAPHPHALYCGARGEPHTSGGKPVDVTARSNSDWRGGSGSTGLGAARRVQSRACSAAVACGSSPVVILSMTLGRALWTSSRCLFWTRNDIASSRRSSYLYV